MATFSTSWWEDAPTQGPFRLSGGSMAVVPLRVKERKHYMAQVIVEVDFSKPGRGSYDLADRQDVCVDVEVLETGNPEPLQRFTMVCADSLVMRQALYMPQVNDPSVYVRNTDGADPVLVTVKHSTSPGFVAASDIPVETPEVAIDSNEKKRELGYRYRRKIK